MRQFQYTTPQGFTADCVYPETSGEQPDYVSHMDIPGQVILKYPVDMVNPDTGTTERRNVTEIRDFVPKHWTHVGEIPDDIPAQCRVTGDPPVPEPVFATDPLLNEKRTINPNIKSSDQIGPRDELGTRPATPDDPEVEHVTDGTPCWCEPDTVHVEGDTATGVLDGRAISADQVIAALDQDAKETPEGVEGGKGGWYTFGDPDNGGFKVQGYDKMIEAYCLANN